MAAAQEISSEAVSISAAPVAPEAPAAASALTAALQTKDWRIVLAVGALSLFGSLAAPWIGSLVSGGQARVAAVEQAQRTDHEALQAIRTEVAVIHEDIRFLVGSAGGQPHEAPALAAPPPLAGAPAP